MNIGYFRLNAYFYPLLEIPKEKLVFKKGSTFKQVWDLYRFDRKLRILLFNEIEKIEIAIRSQVTNLAGLQFDNLFWLTDKNNFVDKNKFEGILSIIEKKAKNSREDFISHFKKTYLEPYPPA